MFDFNAASVVTVGEIHFCPSKMFFTRPGTIPASKRPSVSKIARSVREKPVDDRLFLKSRRKEDLQWHEENIFDEQKCIPRTGN